MVCERFEIGVKVWFFGIEFREFFLIFIREIT